MPSQPFHPESWPRLRALLDELLQLEAEQRPRFLANLEERDAHLRPELERLLAEALALENTPSLTAMDLAVPAVRADLTEQLDLDEERVGQCVGPYRLLRMLGAGGMGVVYLAERDAGEFTHRVAMKLLRTAASNRALKDRFDRERQILASLKHPGIAALFDGGHTEDGQAFYTMEFVDGLPVTEYAYTHLPTVSERIDLLLQIAHALAYAHQNLVVHRDIKPSNVLVDTTGQVKLVDFGLAKLLQPAAPAVMTQAGTMPMTPAYAAPEQFHSDVITVATDIYQFGILCFVVLAGRLPYRADPNDALAWARAVTEEAPMTLYRAFQLANPARDGSAGRYQRALSRDLDAIIGKALAKEPSMRFGSIDAMISDLRAFAEGRPVAARRAGPVYLMSRFIARHPYGVAATVGAFIALASTALVATNQSRIAAAEADRANAVSSFLVGLFQVADPSINRGEHLSANQILEKGSERINREMASQPAERARLQSVIGEVYAVLGEYGRARDALDPAIAVMSSTSSTDSTDLAHALNWRAFISATDGDYKAALAMLDRAAGLLTENTPRQQDELATLHARRASAYGHLNDYASARREYETAIRLRDELGQTSTLKMAGIHNNYGTMLRAINEQALARREFSKALEIFSAQEGDPEKSYFVMGARMNLATALIDLGDPEAARTMLERASKFFRAMTGKANVAYANAENKLGEIERLSHRMDEAYAHYDAAEEAYRSALGDHNYQVASPMQNRGEAALDDGQYEKALSEFTRALALRRESLPDSRREIASALHGRGQALIGLGRYGDARQDLATALDVWTKTLPPNHPMIVYAFFDLARADAALGNVEAAESERLEAERRASIAFIDNPARLRAFQTAVKDLSRNATVQMGSYDE